MTTDLLQDLHNLIESMEKEANILLMSHDMIDNAAGTTFIECVIQLQDLIGRYE